MLSQHTAERGAVHSLRGTFVEILTATAVLALALSCICRAEEARGVLRFNDPPCACHQLGRQMADQQPTRRRIDGGEQGDWLAVLERLPRK